MMKNTICILWLLVWSIMFIPLADASVPSLPPLYVSQNTQTHLASEQYTIPAGTPIQVAVAQEYNSQQLRVGEKVRIQVTLPIVIKGQTLVHAGALGEAVVTRQKSAGVFGRKGLIELKAEYIQATDGTRVPLHGVPIFIPGKGWTALSIIAAIIGLPLLIYGLIAMTWNGSSEDLGEWVPALIPGVILSGFSLLKGKAPIVHANTPLSANVNSDTDVTL